MKSNVIVRTIKYLTILELDSNVLIDKKIIQDQYELLSKVYDPNNTLDIYKDGKKLKDIEDAYKYLISNIEYTNKLINNKFNLLSKDDIKYFVTRRALRKEEKKKRKEIEQIDNIELSEYIDKKTKEALTRIKRLDHNKYFSKEHLLILKEYRDFRNDINKANTKEEVKERYNKLLDTILIIPNKKEKIFIIGMISILLLVVLILIIVFNK